MHDIPYKRRLSKPYFSKKLRNILIKVSKVEARTPYDIVLDIELKYLP
jgi:hypothetical protein